MDTRRTRRTTGGDGDGGARLHPRTIPTTLLAYLLSLPDSYTARTAQHPDFAPLVKQLEESMSTHKLESDAPTGREVHAIGTRREDEQGRTWQLQGKGALTTCAECHGQIAMSRARWVRRGALGNPVERLHQHCDQRLQPPAAAAPRHTCSVPGADASSCRACHPQR